jgi:hypothetical protein
MGTIILIDMYASPLLRGVRATPFAGTDGLGLKSTIDQPYMNSITKITALGKV